MKSLKPSMKENKRYLIVRGEKAGNLKENIERAILDFAGMNGMAKTGLNFIDMKSDSAIIAVNREAVDLVRASLCIFPEKIEVLRVSGTLKRLRGK